MRRKILGAFFIFASIFVTACSQEEEQIPFSEHVEETGEETSKEAAHIFVYVSGAVQREGVYELSEGARVYEAIAKAGGFSENAALDAINQAELLKDEMHIFVPTYEEAQEIQQKEDGKVNLNKATKEELMTLPGVGASRAEGILQYRKENGPFKKIEDIMQISGIKEGLFEKIKARITV